MKLSLRVPYGLISEVSEVLTVTLETTEGSVGLLPHRLDFVAAVVPGILTYQAAGRPEVSLALDQGVVVKVGDEVRVMVRQAVGGCDLDQLHRLVAEEFVAQPEPNRAVLVRLEAAFFHHYTELHRG